MEIIKEKENIDIIIIESKNLKFKFCNFGASLMSLYFKDDPLIMEIENLDDFLYNPQFFNKTLGVVAGRIPDKIDFNNKTYNLKKDGDYPFCLHGGKLDSLSYKVFDYELNEDEENFNLVFKYDLKEETNGIPGSSLIRVIYSISKKEDTFKIIFKPIIHSPSLINLSNHIYWNINRSKDINDYYLKFDSPFIASMYDNLLIFSKEKTPQELNFKEGKFLKDSLDIVDKSKIGTIDNTFIFNSNQNIHQVILKNNDYSIELNTNYDAMNIYVDSSLTPLKFKNYSNFGRRRAIALEPQKFVLPLSNITFDKGESYDYYIEYSIRKEN